MNLSDYLEVAFSLTFHSLLFHFIALQENNDQCLKIIMP